MPKKKIDSKRSIGLRFKEFRIKIKKAQHELADELEVTQSTIANIESGKALPNLNYVYKLYYKYRLNANWLLAGQGDIFVKPNETAKEYAELLNLLQVPFISQIIMAKFVELKVLLKDVISVFFENQEKNEKRKEDWLVYKL